MIRDQRHIYPGADLETVEDVRRAWEAILVDRSQVEGHEITLHDTGEEVRAYVNMGRWVANCPECNDGIACWPDHDKGACLGCGGEFDVIFPEPKLRKKAEKVLEGRNKAVNRNWNPETENLATLQAESVLMAGVPDNFGGIYHRGVPVPATDLLPETD